MVKKYWAYEFGLTPVTKTSKWLEEEGNIQVFKAEEVKKEIKLAFEKTETKIRDYFKETTDGHYSWQTEQVLDSCFDIFRKDLGIENEC